jgi:hypothetical protein
MRCTFVRSERTTEGGGDLRFDLCSWVTPAAFEQLDVLHPIQLRGMCNTARGERVSVRAHLLFGVLLI